MHAAYQIKGSLKTNAMVPFFCQILHLQHRTTKHENSTYSNFKIAKLG